MKNYLLIGLVILLNVNFSFAQSDSIANGFQKEFDQFKQSIENEHQRFMGKNDSIFARFLKDSWEEFDASYNEKEVTPKPVIQPVVKKTPIKENSNVKIKSLDSIRTNISKPIKIEFEPEKMMPKEPGNSGRALLYFDFYGIEKSITNPGHLPTIQSITGENISTYFEETCNSPNITELVNHLKKTKSELLLNDWGYYKLVEKTAQKLESTHNKQALLSWLTLLKSGYNVKVGYTNNKIFLLLPTREEIFSAYYFTIDDVQYYIQVGNNKKQSAPRMKVHTANYPGNVTLSLAIKKLPLLGVSQTTRELVFNDEKIRINQNRTLNDFYKDYPLCDMEIYFSTPLSEEATNSLQSYFQPLFVSKTDNQKVAVLLQFVQKSFEYKTDKEQFSQEKYFFPDELFFYPFSDCEDRAILFCRLVKQFTKLDCIGLDFPGHVNTAIYFPIETEGTYVMHDNKKYTVCDPTYENAPIGYLDTKYKSEEAEVITFE